METRNARAWITKEELYNSSSAGGVAGEMLGSGPEIRVFANGERRAAPDTEMAEAREGGPSGSGTGSGGGGFTAVNR